MGLVASDVFAHPRRAGPHVHTHIAHVHAHVAHVHAHAIGVAGLDRSDLGRSDGQASAGKAI